MSSYLTKLLIALWLFSSPTYAETILENNDRDITLIVGFAAGSANDTVARIIANGLSKKT